MKKVRLLSILMTIVIMSVMLSGCGNATIEGDWVLVKEELADGEIMNQSELEEIGIAETYRISGDQVEYTCLLLGTEINLDMDLVDNGDGTYEFKVGEISFATVTLKRNTFFYVVGEGDDAVTFYYERQK